MMAESATRIAVLGAGIQGTCAALALAERGCAVDLYERQARPMEEASRWNEGKIHLGYLFARDPSLRSARMMASGALRFAPLLSRWADIRLPEDRISAPFHYVVHRDSQVSADRVEEHLQAVDRLLRELAPPGRDDLGRDYLGGDYLGHEVTAMPVERLGRSQWSEHWSPDRVAAVFRTPERSVDPHWLADRLAAAVLAHPRVRFRGESRVEAVRPARGVGLSVALTQDGGGNRSYDHVVNALWGDRLRIDASLGHRPARPWLFRYKLAIHACLPTVTGLPSTTLVLGPFGDLVDFGTGRIYASWYEACRLGALSEVGIPEGWGSELVAGRERQIVATTMDELGRIIPALADVPFDRGRFEIGGGVIFAWGATDVDDRRSGLHQRHAIGVHSHGRYHSIDTGKYGMAPWFALQLAERIRPQRRLAEPSAPGAHVVPQPA